MSLRFVRTSNQYISFPGGQQHLRNAVGGTMMAWVKVEAVYETELYIVFLSLNGSNTAARLCLTLRVGSSNKFRCSARRLDSDSVRSLDSSITFNLNQLYHVAGVAEYNSQYLRLYINGQLDNSLYVSGWTGNSSDTDSYAMAIATKGYGGYNNHFTGILDDVRIYDRALTPVEIQTIYQSKGRDSLMRSLQSRYKMIEDSYGASAPVGDGSIKDSADRSVAGTAINGPVFDESLVSGYRKRRK